MDNPGLIIWNGDLISEDGLALTPASDWMRHAPGFYESIKVSEGIIFQKDLHYERMGEGAAFWKVQLPGADIFYDALGKLVKAHAYNSGKLRVQFCVDIRHGKLDYMAVFEDGKKGFDWLEQGWITAVFKDHFKLAGPDANIKSNHRDIYLMARQWMFGSQLDEAIIINQQGRVVESTICNLWWVEEGVVYTPPLHSGCVNGVMRRFLLTQLPSWGFTVEESEAFPGRLEKASELFLTNAIRGIRWVSGIDGIPKNFDLSYKIFQELKRWEEQQYS
ncbi:MAG: aminotransferase class IV [Bacteroidetes bacterium]|nr:aminotransferase class IV [Bacteroidota bacterium]